MDIRYETNYINQWLQQLGADLSASEFHGLLTGLILTQGGEAVLSWQECIAPELDPSNADAEAAADHLILPFETLLDELNDPLLIFTPLIPDDEEATVDERILALGEWSQGLLFGLSHGQLVTEKLSAESQEFLDDLLEISRLESFERDVESEVNENSLTEITEYIRAGTLTLLDELQPVLIGKGHLTAADMVEASPA